MSNHSRNVPTNPAGRMYLRVSFQPMLEAVVAVMSAPSLDLSRRADLSKGLTDCRSSRIVNNRSCYPGFDATLDRDPKAVKPQLAAILQKNGMKIPVCGIAGSKSV